MRRRLTHLSVFQRKHFFKRIPPPTRNVFKSATLKSCHTHKKKLAKWSLSLPSPFGEGCDERHAFTKLSGVRPVLSFPSPRGEGCDERHAFTKLSGVRPFFSPYPFIFQLFFNICALNTMKAASHPIAWPEHAAFIIFLLADWINN